MPRGGRLAAGLILVGLGLLVVLAPAFWRQNPGVPTPANLGTLEPQLRDYIKEKADWVKKKPFSADRQATLGLVYAANSLYSEAFQAFSNAARLNPKEPLAQLYSALAAEEGDRVQQAAEILRGISVQFPQFGPGLYHLGELSLKIGDLDRAERAFERLTAVAPEEWRGSAGLGEVKVRRTEFEQAVGYLKRALAMEPTARKPHYLLGLAYRGLGRLAEAKTELTIGQDHTDSPMPNAWSGLLQQHIRLLQDQVQQARELEEAGQADRAVLLLAKAYTYHPDDFGLINNLAIALNRAGHPKKAKILLENALRKNDRSLPAYITLSYSCQALGQSERALAAAERAIALSPRTAQAHLAKANVLLATGLDQAAVAELDEASRCDPLNAEIQMQMGDVCWLNLHLPEAALQHYLAATNLNPALAPAYVRLGDYYLSHRDARRAEPVIQMLRELAPNCPELALLQQRRDQLPIPETARAN